MQKCLDDFFGRFAAVRMDQSDATILAEEHFVPAVDVEQAVRGKQQRVAVLQQYRSACFQHGVLEDSQRRGLAVQHGEVAGGVNE